jgi:hypothetical protein
MSGFTIAGISYSGDGFIHAELKRKGEHQQAKLPQSKISWYQYT